MFESFDPQSRQVEKRSAVWTELIIKYAGMLAAALLVFGLLYAGMLMIE